MDSDSSEEIFKCRSYQQLKNDSTVKPKRSRMKKIISQMKDRSYIYNSILRSCLYAMCGCIFTYFIFALMVYELSISVLVSSIFCSVLGFLLVVVMVCSENFRCLICLILPQLFSKRGRQALLAYAFIITLTGPTKNTIQNIGRLSESLVCSRAQLKEASHDLTKAIEQPFYAIKDSFNKMVDAIQENINKFKNKIHSIENGIKNIISIFDSAFSWLSSVVGICNKKLGTPYERCVKSLELSRKNCTLKVPIEYYWACEPSSTAETLCYVAKVVDYMCQLVDVIDEKVVDVLHKKLDALSERTKEMLYVSVNFNHSFEFDTNSSKSTQEIVSEVKTDLINMAKKFEKIFSLTGAILSIFALLLILRVIWYRQRFLASDRFDNHYITSDFKMIDEERTLKSKTPVLPLNKREARRYIPTTSIRLIRSEKISILKTSIFLSLTTIKMAIHIMADYCLFWLMDMIHTFGMLQSNIPVHSGGMKMIVKGDGFLADLYRSMGDSLSLNVSDVKFDPKSCLPIPIHPKYEVYRMIAYILLLSWMTAIFEPYGLRVRHLVMSHYYPERAHQRALWLFHDILRRRSSFLAITKQKIKEKLSKDENNHERVTFKDYFIARIPCLRLFLKDSSLENCTICGDRLEDLIKCLSPECKGRFCKECFEDLNRTCPLCKIADDMENCSDFSIEKDSSDEDPYHKSGYVDQLYNSGLSTDDEAIKPLISSDSHSTQFDTTTDTEMTETSFKNRGHSSAVKAKIENWKSELQLFDDEEFIYSTDNVTTDDESGTCSEKQTLHKNMPDIGSVQPDIPVFTWESMKRNTAKGKKSKKKKFEMIYDIGIENSETFKKRRKGLVKTTLQKIKRKLNRI